MNRNFANYIDLRGTSWCYGRIRIIGYSCYSICPPGRMFTFSSQTNINTKKIICFRVPRQNLFASSPSKFRTTQPTNFLTNFIATNAYEWQSCCWGIYNGDCELQKKNFLACWNKYARSITIFCTSDNNDINRSLCGAWILIDYVEDNVSVTKFGKTCIIYSGSLAWLDKLLIGLDLMFLNHNDFGLHELLPLTKPSKLTLTPTTLKR